MQENREYKSFYKTVSGNEGNKCYYPTRLDAYGCGCAHDCSYCYAKSLLDFRGLWNPHNPSVADIDKIRRKIKSIKHPEDMIVRLGGMTDCFQPCEYVHHVTYDTIKALNDAGIGYLIVTKSAMVANYDYIRILDPKLAHIQISLTTLDHILAGRYEHCSNPVDRIRAIERLAKCGFDVSVRLSPYIPEYVDLNRLSNIKCDKLLVKFLRINSRIRKWLDESPLHVDYSEYSVKHGGYLHLPLEKKIEYAGRIKGFGQITVCDDEDEAYNYWRDNFNPNKNDCCNLRIRQ